MINGTNKEVINSPAGMTLPWDPRERETDIDIDIATIRRTAAELLAKEWAKRADASVKKELRRLG